MPSRKTIAKPRVSTRRTNRTVQVMAPPAPSPLPFHPTHPVIPQMPQLTPYQPQVAQTPIQLPQAPPSTSMHSNNQQLDKFSGNNDIVKVQTWIKLYEVHTLHLSGPQKIRQMLYSLKASALEWYGDEIAPKIDTIEWITVKDKIIQRFGVATATPLITAQRRFLRRTETVEEYYKDKIGFLRQTGLSDLEMVQQLTEGLPIEWKVSITAARIQTPNSWIEVAQQLETHFKQQHKQSLFRRGERTLTANVQSIRKPRVPCRFCLKRGKTLYHWHSECTNRQSNQHTYVKTPAPQPTTQPATMQFDNNEVTLN